MVHVPKAVSSTRLCGDCAVTVNHQLDAPQYQIALPDDVFMNLRDGKRFTKRDLKNACQQLPLDPEGQQYVTINTHRDLYRYKRLSFGIASPAIFQRTMEITLQGLDNTASIQNEIVITWPDDDQHVENLSAVLKRLYDYGVRLQLNKCKFIQKSVAYMGCVISAEGISPTNEKNEAIKKAPRLENSTQLRAFLGMVNYHGKFIRNFCSILQPLNQLLQKSLSGLGSAKTPSTKPRNHLCLPVL